VGLGRPAAVTVTRDVAAPAAASLFAPVRGTFRLFAQTIVPEASRLDESGWRELERIVDVGLADRSVSIKRQLVLLVRLLGVLPLVRYGRTFAGLSAERRVRFLSAVQDSPLFLRRGFWGLRTIVFMGYYGRNEAAAEIGYRADPRGWEARRSIRDEAELTPK
jgi:hypothetical protein